MSETPTIDRAGTAEQSRLQESREAGTPWKLWGPYLSERQWGTVREDYSENGDAWAYFTHDQARSRAYHWGEDGIAGFSDDKQRLCFALALWNGKDPILKERMFGLTNSEGNHGEDVKEYYFYIDSTPTHSYMKMLYKYPQSEFPYGDLVETNRRRGRTEPEYELIDTGVFSQDRYFDVFVEYAKETPTDILIQISVCNRGPDPSPVHVLPTLWFRDVWSWQPETPKPSLRAVVTKNGVAASEAELGDYFLYCEGIPSLLFTENETNNQRIFGTPNAGPYVKDGINDCVVAGRREAAFYLHPTGQIPAYEWNFGDVNPPVHAWAAIFLHRTEQALGRDPDLEFLARVFTKLSLNFTWWTNRKDRFGKNLYEGGFLGLDNIGVFDRSAPLPTGGYLEQADGTAWMALFCQNMLEIGIELTKRDPAFEDLATKFAEQFLWIARAMNGAGPEGMWDEEDGFYYDVLQLPDGRATRLKVRSMVGLLPLCAVTVIEPSQRERAPNIVRTYMERVRRMPDLLDAIHATGPGHLGAGERGIIGLVNQDRLRRILSRMLDEDEFLSPYGIRALSRHHADHPFVFFAQGQEYRVNYLPAESDTGMFGGNSNWRGPIWMPVNALLVRALLQYYLYYGDTFKVECPTGSGNLMNLFEVSREIANRLTRIFLRDQAGRRPVYGGSETFQTDPHWRDYLQFYEYFHGDNGAGIGASHQTGWTGVVAKLIEIFGRVDPQALLKGGVAEAFGRAKQAESAGDPRMAQVPKSRRTPPQSAR